ncbi:hypothetical protein [Streptomyces sp. P9(2023)]|uniref:aromatic-ring hydroxylase C-terminal domain-containing protein n=1 Tax=Streptomyces sp. P9(2023) TaxID=3064394 RepID=UPI0037DD4F8A
MRSLTAKADDKHFTLDGITESLIRPDGHIAWVTRTTDPDDLRSARSQALHARIRPSSCA